MRKFLLGFAAIALAIAPKIQAQNVDLELALLVDVSGSVSTDKFDTQRNGYVAAFNDTGF